MSTSHPLTVEYGIKSSLTTRLGRYKNPKIIGPGVWYVGHLLTESAVQSDDEKDFDLAYGFIMKIKMYFSCGKCRSHFNDYCMVNNPEQFLENRDSKGLAMWWYAVHNNANKHTGATTEKYEEVSKFFRTAEGSCELDCDQDKAEHEGGESSLLKIPSPSFVHIQQPVHSITRQSAPGMGLFAEVKGSFKEVFKANDISTDMSSPIILKGNQSAGRLML